LSGETRDFLFGLTFEFLERIRRSKTSAEDCVLDIPAATL
jgi:hypothetical protein